MYIYAYTLNMYIYKYMYAHICRYAMIIARLPTGIQGGAPWLFLLE